MPTSASAACGLIVSALSKAGERLAAVVLLQQQHAGLVLGRPVVLVGLEGVAVDVVEDELELVGEVVPAGVLAAGQADEQELVGVLDVVVLVAAVGVGADEPAELGVGLLEVAAVAVELRPHPAGQEVLGLGFQGCSPPSTSSQRRG